MKKSHLVACGIAFVSSLMVAACGGASDTPEDTTGDEADLKRAAFTSCQADDDCVTTDRGGCCPSGHLDAVNKNKVSAYHTANACKSKARCPIAMIHDTNVAICDFGTNKCKMIAPEEIRCGGFTPHPHGCSEGFQCQPDPRQIPDIPGTCVPSTPEGQMCGGIAGLRCPSGYACVFEGSYPDAAGTCEVAPATPKCATVRCSSGYHCEERGINGGTVGACIKN